MLAYPRVWPCEVMVWLIRHGSGSCRGPVAPPGAATFTERPGWPEQELAHQRRPPCHPACQARPSPGARPGFPLWKPGCRCGLASEQRMEVWGRACVQSEGSGPGPKRHGPGAQLCGWFVGLKAPGSPRLVPVALFPPTPPRFPTSRAASGHLLSQGLLPESCPERLLALRAVLGCPAEDRQRPPRPTHLRAAV